MTLRQLCLYAPAVCLLIAFTACNNSTGPKNESPKLGDTINPPDTTAYVDTTTHPDTTTVIDTTTPHDTIPVAPKPTSLDINGARTAPVGQAVSLTAVVKDSAGLILSGVPVVWTSSDSTLIQVSSTGTVTPKRIGTVVLTASASLFVRDTVLFTSALSPYTFVFADTGPEPERQLIRDGIQYAHAFHHAQLGRTIQEPTTVSGLFSATGCASGGAAAYTGSGSVVFCLGNQGWKANGPVRKQKIVQHELFHVWQFENKWISNAATAGATWLIEGSAEWMGYQGIAARGLISFETALGCQIKEAADFAMRTPPGLPALSAVETRMAFQNTQGPLYTHSMLAAEYLISGGGTGGPMAFKVYADGIAGGTEWHAAFQTAFAKSTADFYAQFPSWLSAKPVPPNYLCGI
jgi:hypothetical protein